MEPIVIAVLVGILAYVVIVAFIPKNMLVRSTYTKSMLQQIEREAPGSNTEEDANSILRDQIQKSGVITRVFFTLPGIQGMYPKMLKAGLGDSIAAFFSLLLVVFLLLVYVLKNLGLLSVLIAFVATYLVAWWYIRRCIKKRNQTFLNLFPDALDMVVRSVRSGYPLNSAVRMVSENMQAPVSTEFRQVADETSYGSSLVESLQRLATRVDEPDIKFFVVVLAVQQEVGGNLAEVLSNLANIIRKRKHLRMKIQAMTSEGRATAWVLGMLPVMEFLAIYYVAPSHLEPLFTTGLGNLILFSSIGIVLLGVFIVKLMINIEV